MFFLSFWYNRSNVRVWRTKKCLNKLNITMSYIRIVKALSNAYRLRTKWGHFLSLKWDFVIFSPQKNINSLFDNKPNNVSRRLQGEEILTKTGEGWH